MMDQEGLQRVKSSDLEVVRPYDPSTEKYVATRDQYHSLQQNYQKPLPVDENRICGMRRTTLVLVILLALAVIAAAVVGGVLGSQKSSSSQASTPTSTISPESSTPSSSSASSSTSEANSSFVTLDTASFTPPTNVNLTLDCPAINSTTKIYTPTSDSSYRADFFCGMNCLFQNMFATFIYSLDMCVEACLSMKSYNSSSCTGITFRADLANVTTTYKGALTGNCFVNTDCVLADYDANLVTALISDNS